VAGDELLIEVAQRINPVCAADSAPAATPTREDRVARMGGDLELSRLSFRHFSVVRDDESIHA